METPTAPQFADIISRVDRIATEHGFDLDAPIDYKEEPQTLRELLALVTHHTVITTLMGHAHKEWDAGAPNPALICPECDEPLEPAPITLCCALGHHFAPDELHS